MVFHLTKSPCRYSYIVSNSGLRVRAFTCRTSCPRTSYTIAKILTLVFNSWGRWIPESLTEVLQVIQFACFEVGANSVVVEADAVAILTYKGRPDDESRWAGFRVCMFLPLVYWSKASGSSNRFIWRARVTVKIQSVSSDQNGQVWQSVSIVNWTHSRLTWEETPQGIVRSGWPADMSGGLSWLLNKVESPLCGQHDFTCWEEHRTQQPAERPSVRLYFSVLGWDVTSCLDSFHLNPPLTTTWNGKAKETPSSLNWFWPGYFITEREHKTKRKHLRQWRASARPWLSIQL